MQTAFVTGADRGLGLSMAKRLAESGWRVFAGSYIADWPELAELSGQHAERLTIVSLDVSSDDSVKRAVETVAGYAGHIDLVINNAGVSTQLKDTTIRGRQNYDDFRRVYNVNALGALRVTEALLPLTDRGALKRLCFVSSEAGSIERCGRESWYAYCMSKAALNMGVYRLFHGLSPAGYTFRLFHPGWMKSYMSGVRNDRAELEPDDVAAAALAYFIEPRRREADGTVDESELTMRDWSGRDWPW